MELNEPGCRFGDGPHGARGALVSVIDGGRADRTESRVDARPGRVEVLAVNSHGGSIPPPRTGPEPPRASRVSGPFVFSAEALVRAGISGTRCPESRPRAPDSL